MGLVLNKHMNTTKTYHTVSRNATSTKSQWQYCSVGRIFFSIWLCAIVGFI